MTRSSVLVFSVVAACLAVARADPPTVARGVTADDLRARAELSRVERTAMRAQCDQQLPGCDRIALYGHLERAALIRALSDRGLAVDPAPDGKTVRRIHVITMPVFGDAERIFRWANVFHWKTKEHVIERSVLLRPGERYDVDKLDETQRKLRDPLYTSLAVAVPVMVDGEVDSVDVLVVTRDIFSLRMNTNYELQDGQFTYLAASLSENNFLGRRMTTALSFVMDQAAFFVGPLLIDKNFVGQRLSVIGRGGPLINRASFEVEGSESALSVGRPLWSLDSEWGWSFEWSHRYAIERAFRGTDLRTYDAPDTGGDDMLPYEFRQRAWSLEAAGVRQLGPKSIKHLLKAGYQLKSQRPSLLSDFPGTGVARDNFIRDVLPRDERTGVVYGAYEVYTPKYVEYRDIDTYDLGEDVRLGPHVEVVAGVGLRLLGSDENFEKFSIDAGWTLPVGKDALVSAAASLSTRLEHRAFVDRVAAVSLRGVSPEIRVGRIVAELRFTGVYRDASNKYYTLGGDNGLRGYPVNFFAGDRRAVAQVEWRTRDFRWFLNSRWGGLVFYDVGGAGDTAREVKLYQDVGIGIRSLGPQLSPEVFRFDLAIPLVPYEIPLAGGGTRTRGAWPPRFIAGYRQAF